MTLRNTQRRDLFPTLSIESKVELPPNLRRRIVRFTRKENLILGPIKITHFQEDSKNYSMNLRLYNVIEDEMGAKTQNIYHKKFKKY